MTLHQGVELVRRIDRARFMGLGGSLCGRLSPERVIGRLAQPARSRRSRLSINHRPPLATFGQGTNRPLGVALSFWTISLNLFQAYTLEFLMQTPLLDSTLWIR